MVQVKSRRPHGTGKGAGWTKAPHAVRAILEGIVTHLVRCSPRSTHDAWLHPRVLTPGPLVRLQPSCPSGYRTRIDPPPPRPAYPTVSASDWRSRRSPRTYGAGSAGAPSVTPVTPSVAWSPAQDEDVGITAGVHHPLGHVHGELRHRFDLRAGFTIVQDETEFGHPAVEMSRLTQLRSAPRPTWAFGKWCGRRRDGPPPAVRLCSESPGNFQSSGIDRRQRLRYLLGISAGNAG